MGLPPATTCNSVSCGSGCCCFSVLYFQYFPEMDTMGWECDSVAMFAQGPFSQIMSFSRSPAIPPFQAHFLLPGTVWGTM